MAETVLDGIAQFNGSLSIYRVILLMQWRNRKRIAIELVFSCTF